MSWLKLYSEFATDPKVQSMPESMQRRLVMLFCLEASGDLPKLEPHELAQAMRISPDELIRTQALFVRKGFIDDDSWTPRNWDKRQAPTDPAAAERMRKLREKRKKEADELRERSANVRPNITRTGRERSRGVRATVANGSAECSPVVTPDTRARELDSETEEEKDFLPSVPSDDSSSHANKCEGENTNGEVPDLRKALAARTKRRLDDPRPAERPTKKPK